MYWTSNIICTKRWVVHNQIVLTVNVYYANLNVTFSYYLIEVNYKPQYSCYWIHYVSLFGFWFNKFSRKCIEVYNLYLIWYYVIYIFLCTPLQKTYWLQLDITVALNYIGSKLCWCIDNLQNKIPSILCHFAQPPTGDNLDTKRHIHC